MNSQTSIYEYAKQGLAANKNRIALRYYGSQMTYSQLFERIDNVADHLAKLGVGVGSVVSIHLPNCPQTIMAVYAVAKLGGICGMVHPLTPVEALRSYMEETGSRVLITSDQFEGLQNTDFADIVIVAKMSAHFGAVYKVASLLQNKQRLPDRAIRFENLEIPTETKAKVVPGNELAEKCVCYLHSSGTTGTPKIVMHSHRSFNNYVENTQLFLEGHNFSESKTVAVLPFFHAVGLVMILHQFLAGKGQLLVVVRYIPKEVVHLVQKHKVDMLGGVPAMYKSLLNVPQFNSEHMKSLKQCYVFGDVVSDELKESVDTRLDPVHKRHILYEAYSLSEFAPGGTAEGPCCVNREGTAGKAQPGCRVAIWNNGQMQDGPGTGELLLSGNTMMLGYLNVDAADQPFLIQNDIKWLRTGDYGRIDEDGYVSVLGRIKNTIIHNGYNVFPNELEALFLKIPGVKDVCVVGVKDTQKETQRIVAYVVPYRLTEKDAIIKSVNEVAVRNLPRYAVPNLVTIIDEIPKNKSGKVDRIFLENRIDMQ